MINKWSFKIMARRATTMTLIDEPTDYSSCYYNNYMDVSDSIVDSSSVKTQEHINTDVSCQDSDIMSKETEESYCVSELGSKYLASNFPNTIKHKDGKDDFTPELTNGLICETTELESHYTARSRGTSKPGHMLQKVLVEKHKRKNRGHHYVLNTVSPRFPKKFRGSKRERTNTQTTFRNREGKDNSSLNTIRHIQLDFQDNDEHGSTAGDIVKELRTSNRVNFNYRQ